MVSKKIKVLHIISGYGGGISSHIRNLAKEIDSTRIIFDVAGFTEYSQEFIEEIQNINGKVLIFPRPKKVGYIKFLENTVKTMQQNGPYDIVHCHISGYRSIIFRLICSYLGIKTMLLHAHSSSSREDSNTKISIIKRKLNQIISRISATKMISCSTEASTYTFGEKAVDKDTIVYIPNSIPSEKYMINLNQEEIVTIKEKHNISTSALVIGHVGRFSYEKNHIFMVQLIKRMALNNKDFVWIFIGDGDLEKNVKKLISEENLERYVRFLGRREDANLLYKIMDVLILPSIYEGLPTVLIEAQAAGIPCVISNSITREADMGMGIVKYVDLSDTLDNWLVSLREASNYKIPNMIDRQAILKEKKFTNSEAADLYQKLIFQNINNLY